MSLSDSSSTNGWLYCFYCWTLRSIKPCAWTHWDGYSEQTQLDPAQFEVISKLLQLTDLGWVHVRRVLWGPALPAQLLFDVAQTRLVREQRLGQRGEGVAQCTWPPSQAVLRELVQAWGQTAFWNKSRSILRNILGQHHPAWCTFGPAESNLDYMPKESQNTTLFSAGKGL